MIKAVIFDMVGTSVMEKDPSMINQCFEVAFRDHGVHVPAGLIIANRGKDKRSAIISILKELNGQEDLVDPVLLSFKMSLQNNLHNFKESKGLRETADFLKSRKIKIGLGTGLPKEIFEQIFNHLNLAPLQFDYVGLADDIGRGRPHPDMIQDMMRKCQVTPREFLKVGDTVADIQEGKNANVLTAVILSGTVRPEVLIREKPDFVIQSIPDVVEIIKSEES